MREWVIRSFRDNIQFSLIGYFHLLNIHMLESVFIFHHTFFLLKYVPLRFTNDVCIFSVVAKNIFLLLITTFKVLSLFG